MNSVHSNSVHSSLLLRTETTNNLMTQYHCNKCGMGFDTEEELSQHIYYEDLLTA
jgi:hypothetical protein